MFSSPDETELWFPLIFSIRVLDVWSKFLSLIFYLVVDYNFLSRLHFFLWFTSHPFSGVRFDLVLPAGFLLLDDAFFQPCRWRDFFRRPVSFWS